MPELSEEEKYVIRDIIELIDNEIEKESLDTRIYMLDHKCKQHNDQEACKIKESLLPEFDKTVDDIKKIKEDLIYYTK